MPKKPPVLFFDIETGGFNLQENPVLSFSYAKGEHGRVHTFYMPPPEGSRIGEWSAKKVWEPLRQEAAAKRVTEFASEEAGLKSILGVLKQHAMEPGAEVVGWNIGYNPMFQGPGVSGFDIPALITRGHKYGLSQDFIDVFSRLKIRDLGREYAYNIAKTISTSEIAQYLDPDLVAQAKTYARHGIYNPEMSDLVAAVRAAEMNKQYAGWKQELIYQLSTGKLLERAHESAFDVRGMQELYRKPWALESAADAIIYNRLSIRNKLISQIKAGGLTVPQAALKAQRAGITDIFESALQSELTAYGYTLEQLAKEGRINERVFTVGAAGELIEDLGVEKIFKKAAKVTSAESLYKPSVAGLWDDAGKLASTKIGGVVLAGAAAILGISLLFSGSDDAHNTIEALPHEGIAGRMRRARTDFGSGYRGLPSSLMGVPIDPRVLEFRRRVWDDEAARAEMEEYIKEEERAAQARIGVLGPSDLFSVDLATTEGMNLRRDGLKAVRLSRFDVDVEDADTVMLRRKGLLSKIKRFFGMEGEVAIRLAGIDAPEVAAHENDPLAPFRIFQSQPHGEAAAWTLKSILRQQDDATLIVAEDQKSYGRYLGALLDDQNQNINLQLLRLGAVSALPFGPSRTDVIDRRAAAQAENEAFQASRGMWSYSRYQAAKIANREIGRVVTHNVLTRLDKLGANLNLGAYGSFLEEMGGMQRPLSPWERRKAKQLGRALKKTHGPRQFGKFSGKDDNYLRTHGLSHKGVAKYKRRNITEFGSGWIKAFLEKLSGTSERMFFGVGWGRVARRGPRRRITKILGSASLPSDVPRVLQTKAGGLKGVRESARWRILRRIGKGGQGEAFSAVDLATGKRAVYKHFSDIPTQRKDYWLTTPSAVPIIRAKEAGGYEELFGGTVQFLTEANEFRYSTLAEHFNLKVGPHYEASLQHAARMTHGKVVPEVYGLSTKQKGFVMEYAGKPVRQRGAYPDTPEAEGAFKFIKDFWMKQLKAEGNQARHIDPNLENVLFNEKTGQYHLIDWAGSYFGPRMSPSAEAGAEMLLGWAEKPFWDKMLEWGGVRKLSKSVVRRGAQGIKEKFASFSSSDKIRGSKTISKTMVFPQSNLQKWIDEDQIVNLSFGSPKWLDAILQVGKKLSSVFTKGRAWQVSKTRKISGRATTIISGQNEWKKVWSISAEEMRLMANTPDLGTTSYYSVLEKITKLPSGFLEAEKIEGARLREIFKDFSGWKPEEIPLVLENQGFKNIGTRADLRKQFQAEAKEAVSNLVEQATGAFKPSKAAIKELKKEAKQRAAEGAKVAAEKKRLWALENQRASETMFRNGRDGGRNHGCQQGKRGKLRSGE